MSSSSSSSTNHGSSCKHGEPDLANRMESLEARKKPDELEMIWRKWRDVVAAKERNPPGKEVFADMVEIMNEAARRNGEREKERYLKKSI